MSNVTEQDLAQLSDAIAELGMTYDQTGEWPQGSIDLMANLGGWRWNVPAQFGGDPVNHTELLKRYAALAAGCMSTALISTQRDGAIELIVGSENEVPKNRWLPQCAAGEIYTTVGIAQLTTSKRGGGNLMTATVDGDGYRLSGMMPWATGASKAAIIVTGAVLQDGNQILACIPTNREGITIAPCDPLITLNASHTSCVHCADFRVEPDEILRGPCERVLAIRTPVKPLVTSSCGIGLAGRLVKLIKDLPPKSREPFGDVVGPLVEQYETIKTMLFDAADRVNDPEFETPSAEIRVRVNDVLVRAAMVALTLSKGSGFLLDRPVQRHVREALFFLVWSAPQDVQTGTLARLMAPLGADTPLPSKI
ncbi:MAG: acyl-CoA/acyl-ACP dehydrogenase [Phycisphaerales bacterium]|nr:acyl-CoA/acyl-ACP dehydrogenase [Phycisphaerales bacterium]